MTSIESLTLDVADPTVADRFYTAAFGLGTQLRLRASQEPTTGFRGFTLSLTVSRPATVSGLVGAALDAGATPLKPIAKSFWGYGGVVQAPDGTIWKVATSEKKDTGPATRQIDEIVLLLGVVARLEPLGVHARPLEAGAGPSVRPDAPGTGQDDPERSGARADARQRRRPRGRAGLMDGLAR